MMNHHKSFDEIKKTYLLIDKNFDRIIASCENKEQKEEAIEARNLACEAYFEAIANGLKENSDFIEETTEQLKNANDRIEHSIESLQNITEFINLMSEAVKLAKSLINWPEF